MHIAHAVFLCFFPTIFYCNLFSTLAPGEEPFFHTEFTKTTELRKNNKIDFSKVDLFSYFPFLLALLQRLVMEVRNVITLKA